MQMGLVDVICKDAIVITHLWPQITYCNSCYSCQMTRHYLHKRPPQRSPQRHLLTCPEGSTFTSPIDAYYNMYVYTSCLITPLSLGLAPRRLLALLPDNSCHTIATSSYIFCVWVTPMQLSHISATTLVTTLVPTLIDNPCIYRSSQKEEQVIHFLF
jgi:hypothetical protein